MSGSIYGHAASSMNDDSFVKKFGSAQSKAGAKGERILYQALTGNRQKHSGWLPDSAALLCSLQCPGLERADIDFVAISGDRVLAIDAKFFRQDGGWWWNKGKNDPYLYRGLSRYTSHSGEAIHLGRTMTYAQEKLSHMLPEHTVRSMVVFTTDPKSRNAKQPHVKFVSYRGTKCYNMNSAKRYISRFLRSGSNTHAQREAEKILAPYVQ